MVLISTSETTIDVLSDLDDFNCLLQEVLVNGILAPTIDLLSDPDYINQYVAWLVSSPFY